MSNPMSKKGISRYNESYSIGDAQCQHCQKQTDNLTVINQKELCYPCAKSESKAAGNHG